MTITWSPQAIVDLANLRRYIAEDNPKAALRVVLVILNAIEQDLSKMPECGRLGRVANTRELVVPNTPVIVPYRIQNAGLEILGVHHHARRWPSTL